jgi:hypothetical protein
MTFHDKYELLAHLRNDGIKTDIVREVATGRALEAHHFVAGRTPENDAIWERLNQAGPMAARLIIEKGELDGVRYVVAEVLPDRQPFRAWVESLPVSAPPPPAAAPAAETLSFTAMFATTPEPTPAKPAKPSSFTAMFATAPPPEAGPTPEPPPAKPAEPSSFTAMFPTAPPAPAPPPSARSAAFERGETLPSFQAPKLQPPDPKAFERGETLPPFQAPPGPPAFQRGETLPPFQAPPGPPAFQRGETLPPFRVPTSLTASASEVTPTAPPPGEFTRMFSPNAILADRSGAAAPPAGAGNRDDDFMKLFQVPSRDKPGTSMSSAPAPPPGEFTRMFAAPTQPASPAPPSIPPAPSTPGSFTQMFSATPATPNSTPAKLPDPSPFPPLGGLPPAKPLDTPGQFTQMFGSAGTASTPPPANFPPTGGLAEPPSSATQVFTTPSPTAGGPGPSAPAGPSEYTRVFAAPKAPGAGGPTPPPLGGSPAGLPDFQMPPMPQVPQMPQLPQMPQFPPMPQAPQMPYVQMPQVPQLPQAPVPAPKSNALPLVLFGALLVIAILVVAYFALRG